MKKSITLRMEEWLIESLKTIAKEKSIGYQTLIRLWIFERLKRERDNYNDTK